MYKDKFGCCNDLLDIGPNHIVQTIDVLLARIEFETILVVYSHVFFCLHYYEGKISFEVEILAVWASDW
jgi:hypothetical protein